MVHHGYGHQAPEADSRLGGCKQGMKVARGGCGMGGRRASGTVATLSRR
jgi:hypothetical protein